MRTHHRARHFAFCFAVHPVTELMKREGIAEALETFAKDRELGLFVIMGLTKSSDNNLEREIVFYARDRASISSFMDQFLASSEAETLDLRPLTGIPVGLGGASAGLWCFAQGQIKASRKQVEPFIRRVLMESLKDGNGSAGNGTS